MAEVIRYVDPDVAAGDSSGDSWVNAYASLNAWEAAEQADLVTDTDWHHVYCRNLSGSADTTATTIDGWSTGAAYYIQIEGADGYQACANQNYYDNTCYRLETGANSALTVAETNVKVVGIQINVVHALNSDRSCLVLYASDGNGTCFVDSCILKHTANFARGAAVQIVNNSGNTVAFIIANTVMYQTGTTGGKAGLLVAAVKTDTVTVYNSTISGFTAGIDDKRAIVDVYNSAVFNNTDDFDGVTGTIDYCASDDGDGTNAEDFTAEATDWAKVFTDYANGDFSLKDYTTNPCCVGEGTDDPGSGLYSDDIAGTARASTWDIGAFELAAGGISMPVAYYHLYNHC